MVIPRGMIYQMRFNSDVNRHFIIESSHPIYTAAALLNAVELQEKITNGNKKINDFKLKITYLLKSIINFCLDQHYILTLIF